MTSCSKNQRRSVIITATDTWLLSIWDAHSNVERHRGQSLWSLASQAGLMRLSTRSSADRIIGSREVSPSKGRSKTCEICQQNSKDSARTGGPVLSSQRPQFCSKNTEHYTNTICNLIESVTDLIVASCNCRYCFIHTVNSIKEEPERNKTNTRTHTRKQQEGKHEFDVEDNRIRTALFRVITQWVVVISCRRLGTTYRSHLQDSRIQNSWTLKTGTIGCP